jgi:hypothetical protein
MNLTHATWKKSSYSGGNEGLCLEVAVNLRNVIAVRDSKTPNGPAIIFTPAQWSRFLHQIKNNELEF